jgi:predicted transporter
MSVLVLFVITLSAPVAAAAAGFVVTAPGTLVLLGAVLVGVGSYTRRLFSRKKGLERA